MELTYPWGLVYLIILIFFVLLSAALAAKVTVQKWEIKDLLGRRDRKDKPKQHREHAKFDMAEMSAYAAYYGGYTYEY